LQNLATIFHKVLHLSQEIYWQIALLAYDEQITTLRGSVEMTGTQKPVSAITFVAPRKVFFWRLFMESGKSRRRLSTNQREVTILTWVPGLNP